LSSISDEQRGRLEKLPRIREAGIDPYPARATRTMTVADALARFGRAEDSEEGVKGWLAGRLMSIRLMGKAAFAHIADGSGRIQIYLRRDDLGEEAYEHFRRDIDIGDFIGARGEVFRTRTGEATFRVKEFVLLAKALRPLPEKWHGLKDVETRYRQRYLDLVVNEDTRRIFTLRSRIISAMRRFLDDRGFMEVETPVLQPIYGGAAAQPFETYHRALDRKLYLRIATELYLKRLIVGGLDRVYEIGKNFRNEGISTRHNPEFTVMELYQAYADYNDIMALVEEMIAYIAQEALGSLRITYDGNEIDLTPPWARRSLVEAIAEETGIDILEHPDRESLLAQARGLGLMSDVTPTWGKMVDELFSTYVEPKLIQPTFVVDYPLEISPLAKRRPGSQVLVERFEGFIGGLELANAFTELNDPLDQRERFEAQVEERGLGDDEAHPMDEDFVQALEYGMPPTGGLGIGVDRLVMLLTDQTSIREVILFPQLRSKGGEG